MNPFRSLIAGALLIFGAAANTIEELRSKLQELQASAQGLQDLADAEKRDLTEAETKQIADLFAAFDATELEIRRREDLQARADRIGASAARIVRPDPTPASVQNAVRPAITGGEPAAVASSRGTGGFRAFGDFANAVHSAAGGRQTDPRLSMVNAAAATTYGQEGVGADGGYMVPPDFKATILSRVLAEDSLLSRCDQTPTTSNSITVPIDEDSPWATSGIQATWEGEATTFGQGKPALKSTTVRANKITALVPVTDELLEDAPSLESFLRQKAPAKIDYKVNDAIINGDGVGKPMGFLASPCLVTQAAEGGQTAGTVNFANISKMYSRMPAANRKNAVWIINQDLEPQLDNLVVPGAGASVAAPAYMPPGGMSASPFATLKGRPVIYTEAANALGAVGDITFADLSAYLAVVKSGGLKTDFSIHLWFDQGLSAFRFVLRIGGRPWWNSPMARAKSANTLSPFVALAAR